MRKSQTTREEKRQGDTRESALQAPLRRADKGKKWLVQHSSSLGRKKEKEG